MAIASDIVFWWPGSVESIPAGWSRNNDFNSKYIQGAATGGNSDLVTARGNATHTHTSPSHTPTQNAHTHQFDANGDTPDLVDVHTGLANDAASPEHVHVAATSNSRVAVNQGVAITVNSTAHNEPPFIDVIAIKSNGTPNGVPSGALGLFLSDVLPLGWTRQHGGRFLRCADASAPGGSTGGSAEHIHTSPEHTHGQNTHNHSATTSAANTDGAPVESGGTPICPKTHTHQVSFLSTTATNQPVTTTIDPASNEPVFKKVNILKYELGGEDLPLDIIGVWPGTNGTIPSGWARVTELDGYFPKGAENNGETLATGGATTHSHTASSCQPIQNSHTHTLDGNESPDGTTGDELTSPVVTVAAAGHFHTWNCSSATATNQSVAVTINACASEAAYPPYVRAIYIKCTTPFAGAILRVTETSVVRRRTTRLPRQPRNPWLTLGQVSDPATDQVESRVLRALARRKPLVRQPRWTEGTADPAIESSETRVLRAPSRKGLVRQPRWTEGTVDPATEQPQPFMRARPLRSYSPLRNLDWLRSIENSESGTQDEPTASSVLRPKYPRQYRPERNARWLRSDDIRVPGDDELDQDAPSASQILGRPIPPRKAQPRAWTEGTADPAAEDASSALLRPQRPPARRLLNLGWLQSQDTPQAFDEDSPSASQVLRPAPRRARLVRNPGWLQTPAEAPFQTDEEEATDSKVLRISRLADRHFGLKNASWFRTPYELERPDEDHGQSAIVRPRFMAPRLARNSWWLNRYEMEVPFDDGIRIIVKEVTLLLGFAADVIRDLPAILTVTVGANAAPAAGESHVTLFEPAMEDRRAISVELSMGQSATMDVGASAQLVRDVDKEVDLEVGSSAPLEAGDRNAQVAVGQKSEVRFDHHGGGS